MIPCEECALGEWIRLFGKRGCCMRIYDWECPNYNYLTEKIDMDFVEVISDTKLEEVAKLLGVFQE